MHLAAQRVAKTCGDSSNEALAFQATDALFTNAGVLAGYVYELSS
jgi:hypothetical protein